VLFVSSRRRLAHRLTDAFVASSESSRAAAVPALFGGGSAGNADHFRRIPIDRIRPRADAPRRSSDAALLAELTDSIRAHGVLQPIRLRPCGPGTYEIIAGERRWRAAQAAGLRHIPAVITVADDDQAYVESLIENVQREDLNAVDRALALKQLRVNLGLQSWEEVGRVIGVSRQHVHNLLRITELPEPMQDDVRAGDLSEKHCRALLRLRDDPDAQEDLWEQIHRDHLSGDAAIAESKRRFDVAPPPRVASPLPSRPRVGAAVDTLMQALGQATADELRDSRLDLEELHGVIAGILATMPPSALRAPLPHLVDDSVDAPWHGPVLVPVAGHQAI
jgi:ParB family chromosome partitioning protein